MQAHPRPRAGVPEPAQRPSSATSAVLSTARDERGFTLVELLLAMLILGLLAAIALSTFLGRRVDAGDASAKSLLNTAAKAATVYGLSSAGYTGMTPAALQAQVPSINITANGQPVLAAAAPTLTGYTLAVVSSTADTFFFTYANGVATRTCTVATGNGNTLTNTGGGCSLGHW